MLGFLSMAALAMVALIAFLADEFAEGTSAESVLSYARAISLWAAVLLCMTTALLWVEGWIFLCEGWADRSYGRNALIVSFQLLGPVFAAYTLHFVRKASQRERLTPPPVCKQKRK
jgi:hypothetical protein